jgi:hypothetical protein
MQGGGEEVAGYIPAQPEPTEDGRSRFFPRAELPGAAELARGAELTAAEGRAAEGRAPIELCVMQSVSPAYNPRETWSAQKQHARGFDDCWARRPAALYPWKRADWFAKAFAAEEAVSPPPPPPLPPPPPPT